MIEGYSPEVQALFGTLFTWFVTALGSSLVFLVPSSLDERHEGIVLDASLGFAAGVMLAASYWSLLAPAIELSQEKGMKEWSFLPAAIGFVIGSMFVMFTDDLLPEPDAKSLIDEESKAKGEAKATAKKYASSSSSSSSYQYMSAAIGGQAGGHSKGMVSRENLKNERKRMGGEPKESVAVASSSMDRGIRQTSGLGPVLGSDHPESLSRMPPRRATPQTFRSTEPSNQRDEEAKKLGDDGMAIVENDEELSQGSEGLENSESGLVGMRTRSREALRKRKEGDGYSSSKMDGAEYGFHHGLDDGNNDNNDDDPASKRKRKTSWRRVLLLVLAITIHNFPEGLAVGVAFGAIGKSASSTFNNAFWLAIGIGIQNFPEGLAVSLPMRRMGFSKLKCFWYGQLSGMVEPVGGILGAAAVHVAEPLLPYALSFAAGAMVFVCVEAIIPEAHSRGNGRLASISSIVGFVVMMTLDVALG